LHGSAPPRVRAGRRVSDLARSGRPATVNYRVVYRWFVCWRICPLPLSATYARESDGNRESAHHKKWWFCLTKIDEEMAPRNL